MNGGKRPRAGRKAVKIDLSELEKLASLQCTEEELAHFFDVSVRTIERRKKKPAFAAAIERGRAKGRRECIRRRDYQRTGFPDHRFIRTAAIADMFLQLRAGADIAFLGGLIHYALENQRVAKEYLVC